MIDALGLREIQERIAELQGKKSFGRMSAAESRELNELQHYLSGAVGLGRMPRKMTSEHNRLHARVAKAITHACKKIERENPVLAVFLRNAIKTRGGFSYLPDHPVPWAS